MTVFPSGPMTPLAGSLLLDGIDEHLWATSADGVHTFYLKGPFSPIAPGLPGQDGIVIQSVDMSAPFKHKDLQAADQDGVTWTETVYDPGMVTLVGEAHAATAQGLTQVWDTWQGMWNPRELVLLEHISNDGGFWYAPARLADAWQGAIKQDRRFLYRPFTHKCRIDDTFWLGLDSTDTFPHEPIAASQEDFTTESGALSSSYWTVSYSGGHTGTVQTANGVGAYWSDSGTTTQSATCISTATTSTDYQAISIQLGRSWEGFTLGGAAYNEIRGRVDGSGNAVVCRIGWTSVEVYRSNAGSLTLMFSRPLNNSPRPGEWWTFVLGTAVGHPRSYALYRGATERLIFDFEEVGTGSVVGASARGFGFGMVTAGGTPMDDPIPVAQFYSDDNSVELNSYYVLLSNIGTEDSWPTYTLTGPGTFILGDGPDAAGGYVSIGPLGEGQVAFVNTLPRVRSIVDLTSGGNLYPLMSGRFRVPIPGVATPAEAQSVVIPVNISGGNAGSQIVATLTPRRVHPA